MGYIDITIALVSLFVINCTGNYAARAASEILELQFDDAYWIFDVSAKGFANKSTFGLVAAMYFSMAVVLCSIISATYYFGPMGFVSTLASVKLGEKLCRR